MTAVANAVFSAAQFNTYVRDNLNETMVAKASAAGQYFMSDGPHQLSPRTPASNTTTTSSQSITTDGTYYDITGGTVTLTTGTDALVHISGWLQMSAVDRAGLISFRVSGDTTLTPDDHQCRIIWDGINSNQGTRMGSWGRLNQLSSGSNTFRMQGAGPIGGTFEVNWCHIFVLPL